MPIKGYSDRFKSSSSLPDYGTVGPVRQGQFGLDVISHQFVQVISSAVAAEATSTARVIKTTAHSAVVGDVISWTSGALNTFEYRIQAVATNTITLAETAVSVPATNDTFNVLRPKYPAVSSSGGISITLGGYDSTKTTVATNLYSSTNVTTAAYVQIIAATTNAINMLFVADTSGQFLILATGAAASEVDRIYIPPGGSTAGYPISIPAGTRIALKAIGSSATTGRFILTGM